MEFLLTISNALRGEVVLVDAVQRGLLVILDKYKKTHFLIDLSRIKAWDGSKPKREVDYIDLVEFLQADELPY